MRSASEQGEAAHLGAPDEVGAGSRPASRMAGENKEEVNEFTEDVVARTSLSFVFQLIPSSARDTFMYTNIDANHFLSPFNHRTKSFA